jgi:L-asparaginase / beta-aspartyl-peptidase
MMLGRVGDAALPGVGFFAGSKGAVAVTGIGEYNSRVVLAHTVYRWIESGMPLQQALDLGVAALPEDIDTGIIGVTASEAATSANRPMPTHIIRK